MLDAQSHKIGLYGPHVPTQHSVAPLVMSQFGSFGPQFAGFLQLLHEHVNGVCEDPSWSVQHFQDMAFQSISVAFWRSLGQYFSDYVSSIVAR